MSTKRQSAKKTRLKKTSTTAEADALCEHGLPWFQVQGERLCALEYMNRFVAPHRVLKVTRTGTGIFLLFDTGEKLECCCENCGESHGDDTEFLGDVTELASGRRALRFRLEPDGHLVIWFARGDHLHLHRNALVRFRPRTVRRSVRSTHTTSKKPSA